jgi:large subunit ribosomal protein L17
MYKRIKTKKLGRTMAHRKALIKNQIRSLVHTGSIKTTTAKAKAVKGELESLMNRVKNAKEGDLNIRRELQVILGETELVKKFVEFSKREGSKVVVRKIGFRDGDNSEVSQIVIEGLKVKKVKRVAKKSKDVEEESKVEKKEPERKNILNLGAKKSVSQKAGAVNKERAKSRSGL